MLGAAAADERVIRVEPAGVTVGDGHVLAGLDIQGGRHLLVPAPASGMREDRRSAGVQIRSAVLEDAGRQVEFVDVVCLVPRLNDLFAEVASDMLEALTVESENPAAVCHNVLECWRELLERPDPRLLGPEQLAGLFGELLVLKDIASYDPHRAMDTWTGPAKDEHDFTGAGAAIEVKTTTVREGRVVRIHGVEQLAAPLGGTLFLAFIRLDVDVSGTSVPALVAEIFESGVDRRAFLERLARAGYDQAKSLEYELPAFIPCERRVYPVAGQFPRIISESFSSGHVPPGVLRLRYEIDLTGEPPGPLDDAEAAAVFRGMTTPA